MFEQARQLWSQYQAHYSAQWTEDDPRSHLVAEVANRLNQLDLILDLLARALDSVAIDPDTSKAQWEYIMLFGSKLGAGELTSEEYLAGLPPLPDRDFNGYVRGWEEVRLFTEMFYLVAWRLVEILNASGERAFPQLGRIDARGVRDVRNRLIQHPEADRSNPNCAQTLVVTDDGPVLKSSGFLIPGGSRRVVAETESLDRGLYVNSEDLRKRLEEAISQALVLHGKPVECLTNG